MAGNPSPRRYRALNVLEELDAPGEFVIDRAAGRLYLWPPDNLQRAQVTLATLDAPLLALRDAAHIRLAGFVVESGLDNGMEVTGGTDCEIARCEVRNLRRLGIRVTGGSNHRVLWCDIHHTGQGGLVLERGDRKTLVPAGHEAINNHIWRFSEHQLTSAYGLSFEGVGNRAAHNLIHDAPHQAVFVGGNDHVFEFNEVHHVCTETDDCGALYKGRNPSCRGNQIRYNYWHDIGSPMGHGNAAVTLTTATAGTPYSATFSSGAANRARGPSARSSLTAGTGAMRRTMSSWTASAPWARRLGTTPGGGTRSMVARIASLPKSSSRRSTSLNRLIRPATLNWPGFWTHRRVFRG